MATPAYSKMLVTHFGSSTNGVTIWWDNTTDATKLTAYMHVKIPATPLIIEAKNVVPATCSSNDKQTFCADVAAGSALVTTASAYVFGFIVANPSKTATPLFDGVKCTASLNLTPPASFTTGSFTGTATVTAGVKKDIKPADATNPSADDTVTDEVTLGVTGTTDLCTEWWTLDFPRIACVSWY